MNSERYYNLKSATAHPITYMAAQAGVDLETYISALYFNFPTVVFPEWDSSFMGYCTIG